MSNPARTNTFDFDEFVKSRTKLLTAESYQTPPPKRSQRKRAEKVSGCDSGVHNKASPKFDKPCLCNNERGDLKLSEFFKPRAEKVQQQLYRPFDSLPCKDLLVSWRESYERQGKKQYSGKKRKHGDDVFDPVHDENSRKAGLDYITEAKNYFNCNDKSFYMAMKYFDAYIVRNNWENWEHCNCSIVLLCFACMTLAAKLEDDDYHYIASASGFPKSVFTKMEIEVWKSCDWRLWLTTPFEVLDIIVREKADNAVDRNELYSRASQLILAFGMTDNGLVEVAFAALLAVMTHRQSITKEQVEEFVLSFKQYTNVNPLSCLDIIHKMENSL